MNKEYKKQVASTILNQMGGKGFILMTGAHTITSRSHKECPALSFKYKMDKKHNYCVIHLDPQDTYTMTFGKIRKFEFNELVVKENLYCDKLLDTFSKVTGLATQMPRILT